MEIAELVIAPLSLDVDLAPLLLAGLVLVPVRLAELEGLGFVLMGVAALVAADTAHHSAVG